MKFLIPIISFFLMVPITAFDKTPLLANLAKNMLITINAPCSLNGSRCDRHVLGFSGSVYDFHRHKVITFGGGHATANFPNEVLEFDLATLTWSGIIDHVECTVALDAPNQLYNSGNQKLGGFTYNGNIYAHSRHTYDGMLMASDTCLMLLIGGPGDKGCVSASASVWDQAKGGHGLFMLDPKTKKWSVSQRADLAGWGSAAAIHPSRPDWIYYYRTNTYGTLWKTNWKTEEKINLGQAPFYSVDHSMTAYPYDNVLYAFVGTSGDVWEYDLDNNTWTNMNPSGPRPGCYSNNVVYDTLQKVFCCFSGGTGGFHYYSPVRNQWFSTNGVSSLTRIWHNHIYDPVNNVHFMIGDAWNWINYAYKFSDIPGEFPGTGLVPVNTEIVNENSRQTVIHINVDPNPFKPFTVIRAFYREGEGKKQHCRLEIFNVKGERVDVQFPKRQHLRSGIIWDASKLPGGIYILRVTIGKHRLSRPMVLSP